MGNGATMYAFTGINGGCVDFVIKGKRFFAKPLEKGGDVCYNM